MFGDNVQTSPKVSEWLDALKKAEPDTSLGELVGRNLEQDSNVAADMQSRFLDLVADADETTTPDEAVKLYRETLDSLEEDGLTFDSAAGEKNKLTAIPFEELARSVDFGGFMHYNYPEAVPQREIRKKTFVDQVAKRVADGTVDRSKFRGDVGWKSVWATHAQTIRDKNGNLLPSREVRNLLGLDDPNRFGQGRRMVVFFYPSDRMPDGRCYRPTVLDAGWCPAGGAFLPSDKATEETGYAQNLSNGEKGAPEILHLPFPAKEMERLEIPEELSDDPPVEYRAKRLDG